MMKGLTSTLTLFTISHNYNVMSMKVHANVLAIKIVSNNDSNNVSMYVKYVKIENNIN